MKLQSCIFVLFFNIQVGFSQTHIYQHFGVDEGLPSSEVYDIYQDKTGHIWFATDKGLSRYNGYEFKNYTTNDGLPGNTVLKFYPQENGQIWAYEYHTKTLFYFNTLFDGFYHYKHNAIIESDIIQNAAIKSVYLDKNENIYIGGYAINGLIKVNANGIVERLYASDDFRLEKSVKKRKLYLNDQGFFMSIEENINNSEGVIKNAISSHIKAFILNTQQNLFVFDRDIYLHSKNNKQKISFENQVIGAKRIDNSTFFAGVQFEGAMIINNNGNILNKYLPNKSVSAMLIDHEGGYWFSTIQSGVYYIKNHNINTLLNNNISSLTKNLNNELYVGSNSGNVYKYNNTGLQRIYESHTRRMPAKLALDESSNTVYGISDYQLINLKTKEKQYVNYAISLSISKKKPHLIANRSSILTMDNNNFKYFPTPYIPQNTIWFNQDILIGTNKGLLQKTGDSVHPFNHASNLFKNRVDDIDLYKSGFILSTQGYGVVIYDNQVHNITESDGLSNNIVNEANIENDSIIWACTNTGLNRIEFDKKGNFIIEILNKDNGLISNEVTDVEIIRDTIWVGTKQGLCSIPMNIFKEQQYTLPHFLKLQQVDFNNKKIYEFNDLKFPYGDNTINFYTQAISYKNDINYNYRIKELNENWTSTINRHISFQSLPAGKYTFQAKACISSNCSDEIIDVPFKITPPFYKRWWFYMLCLLSLVSLVYLIFKVRVLTYNKDVFRELIRLAIKRLKRKEQFYKFRSNGEDFKIPTHEIQYINSQGNYLDITTNKKTYTIRCKIGDFINTTPDFLEYLRIHRSYIIRIDQVSSKGRNWVVIKDQKLPVGETYLSELVKIQF